MESDDNRSAMMADDDKHAKQVRKLALILLLGLVVAVVGTLLSGGREYLPVTAWLLFPGGLGILGAIRMLRHPERVGRLHFGNEFDEIIARGGLDLSTGEYGIAPVNKRIAVQDALDSVRRQLGPRRRRVAGRVAAGVGTLGWLAGAVASAGVGHDVATAGICIVATAGFGALTLVFD